MQEKSFPRSGEGNGWRWFEADVILGIPILRDREKKTIKLSNLFYIKKNIIF